MSVPLKKMLQTFSEPEKTLAIDSFFFYIYVKALNILWKKKKQNTKNTAANKTLSTKLVAIL